MRNNTGFSWNVLVWDVNHDCLKYHDVVPGFKDYIMSVAKSKRPKTRDELSSVLDSEAAYHYWSRCEWEILVQGWPKSDAEKKIDVYQQLKMNWDAFIDGFWEKVCRGGNYNAR